MSDRPYPRFPIPNRSRPVFSAQAPLRPNWPHPPPPQPHTMNGAFPPPYPLPRYHGANMVNRLVGPLKTQTYPILPIRRNSDSHFPAQSRNEHVTRKDATSRRKIDINTSSPSTYMKPNRKASKAPSDVIVLDGADNASSVCAQARSQQGDLTELGSNKNAKQKTSVIVDNSQKQKQSKSSLQLSPSSPPFIDLESAPVQLSPPQIVKESVQQPTGQRIPVQDCHHQGGLTDQAALQTAVHQEGVKGKSSTQRDTQQVVFQQENVQQKISPQETSKQQIPSRESHNQQHLIVESTQQQPPEEGIPQEQPPEKGNSQQQPPEKGKPHQLSEKGSPQQLNNCKEQHQNTLHDFPTQESVGVSEESHPHDSPIEGTHPQVNSVVGTRPHDSPADGTRPQANSIEGTHVQVYPSENTHPQANPVTGTHPKDSLLKGIHPKDTPSEYTHPQDTPSESTRTQVSPSPGPHLQYPPENHGQQGLMEDECQHKAVPRQEQLLENGKGVAHLGASLQQPDQQPMTNVVEELPFEQTYHQITPNNTEQPEELSPHEVSFKEVVQQELLLEETSQPSVPHHKTSDSFGPVVNVVGPCSPVPDLLFQPDPCQQVSHEETTTSKIGPSAPVPSLVGNWHSTTSPQQLLPVVKDAPYGNTEPVVTTLLEESSIAAGYRQSVISPPVVKKETQSEFMKSSRISPSGSAASSDSDLSLDLDSVDEDFISGPVCNHGEPERPKNGCSFESLAVCPKCFVIAKVDGNHRQPIQFFEENRVLYAHTIVQGPSSSPKQLLKRINESGLKRAHEETKNHQRMGIQESSPAVKCRTILSIPARESLLPAYQLNTQELVNGLDDSQRSISPAVPFDTSGTKEKFDTYSISSQDNDDDYSSDGSTDMDYHSSAPLEGSGLTSFSAGHIRGASRRGWSTLLLDELGAGLDQQKLELLQEFSPGDVSVWKKLKTKKSTGESPLHNACSRGNVDMARYFMFIEGVSPDIQDNAGWAPLHEACSHRQHAVANLLLESGASTSVCARDGTMPIHDAVEAGDLVMVKTLVHHGADITPDSGERYPVDIAKSKGYDAIVEYLQSISEKFIATKRLESTPCLSDLQIDRQPSVSRELSEIPQTGIVKFGPELDYRQFYCSPFFDESASPVPVAYNLQVPVMHSPTCHNFYTFDELIKSSGMSEEDLRRFLKEANIVTCRMEAKEFREQVKLSRVNAVPVCMRNCYKDIELVPDCAAMRDLLQIKRINLENLF